MPARRQREHQPGAWRWWEQAAEPEPEAVVVAGHIADILDLGLRVVSRGHMVKMSALEADRDDLRTILLLVATVALLSVL